MKDQSFILRRGLRNFASLVGFLSNLPTDKEFQVTISDAKKERSDLQNRALWGCAYKHIREATGNDKDMLHEYFCGSYWGWDVVDVMGMKKKTPKRTTTTGYDGERNVISTLELSDFYAFIQQRAAEVANVYVPDPDPMWWSHTQERAA